MAVTLASRLMPCLLSSWLAVAACGDATTNATETSTSSTTATETTTETTTATEPAPPLCTCTTVACTAD